MSEYKLGTDTGRVIKIDGDQTVVIFAGKIKADLGKTFRLNHWCMDIFRDLTEEEYKTYVGKKMYTYEDLKDKKIVVHCNTKEKSEKFIDFVASEGKGVNIDYYQLMRYDKKEETCYNIEQRLMYCHKSWYLGANYEVIDFDQVDFNDVKMEGYKMKYKAIKTLSLNEILKDNPCKTEFNKVAKKFSFFEDHEWTEENEEFIMKQSGWISFLLQKGFIEEVTDEYLHNFSEQDKVSLSNGAILIMYQIRERIGVFFKEDSYNRYKNTEFDFDKKYNLKTLTIGRDKYTITHINGRII